jgi:hypothetical protein
MKIVKMRREYKFELSFSAEKTPEVFNVDNPVQAEGAARGRDTACHVSTNPGGVELRTAASCAPTEHRDRALHRHTPSCASLARGYYLFASYGGVGCSTHLTTVALGYCLDRFALYKRKLLFKRQIQIKKNKHAYINLYKLIIIKFKKLTHQ